MEIKPQNGHTYMTGIAMPKRPKTVGDLVKVLSRYNQDLPLQIELLKNYGKDSLYGEIDDVYKGEDIMTDDETVFIRFED